jgi:GrpB-like predicted nucleotidyltransferase (UPF0157 family)
MTRPLELSVYDPAWPARFEALAEEIRRAIGDYLVTVEHIGSTAVPGLIAKPTIDIAAAVSSAEAAEACVAPLAKRGWEHRGQYGDDPQRRYFVLDRERPEGRERVAQLYMWILPAPGWNRHLAFRDMLRSDAALREAYNAEKMRLVATVSGDRAAYTDGKAPFIERALQRGIARGT